MGSDARGPPAIPKLVAIPPHMATQCTLPSKPLKNAALSVIKSIGIARHCGNLRGGRCRSVDQDVERWRVQIIKLSAAHRPDEAPDGQAKQGKADWHQQ